MPWWSSQPFSSSQIYTTLIHQFKFYFVSHITCFLQLSVSQMSCSYIFLHLSYFSYLPIRNQLWLSNLIFKSTVESQRWLLIELFCIYAPFSWNKKKYLYEDDNCSFLLFKGEQFNYLISVSWIPGHFIFNYLTDYILS